MEVKSKKNLIQFIKFALVGIMNTVIDFGVYTVLVSFTGVHYAIAQAISYTCGLLNSYLFNTLWTFREERQRTAREFLLFVAVNIATLLVSIGILYVFRNFIFPEGNAVTDWMVNGFLGGFITTESKAIEILSKLIAPPITIILNFLGNKIFVFCKGSGKN